MTHTVVSTSPSFGKFVFEPVTFLQDNDCLVASRPELKTEDALAANLADADALIVGFEPVTARVLAAAQRLKVVAKHGAGVDNIDVDAATAAGVAVVSAPGANSEAVAELTIGLFLSLARAIPRADRGLRGGQWPRVVGTELAGKTLGIVGLGQIGRLVAARSAGFDMTVLAHDTFVSPADANKLGIELTALERVLAEADFLSLHVPLTDQTRGLIGAEALARMKPGAFLVNVSRGGVVDETALCQALESGRIGGAALDVFETEPIGDSPLLQLENFVATPHMAGYTTEALVETGMVCCRAILDVLGGRRPNRLVNPDVVLAAAR